MAIEPTTFALAIVLEATNTCLTAKESAPAFVLRACLWKIQPKDASQDAQQVMLNPPPDTVWPNALETLKLMLTYHLKHVSTGASTILLPFTLTTQHINVLQHVLLLSHISLILYQAIAFFSALKVFMPKMVRELVQTIVQLVLQTTTQENALLLVLHQRIHMLTQLQEHV